MGIQFYSRVCGIASMGIGKAIKMIARQDQEDDNYNQFLCTQPLADSVNMFFSFCLCVCWLKLRRYGSNVSATPIGQTGLEMGLFPLGKGVCLIMNKAPSDSPIWQLKKRELLLPLSFLITKPLKLDSSNLHYGPHYKPHYRTQGCVIREDNITTPLQTPLRTPLRILQFHYGPILLPMGL